MKNEIQQLMARHAGIWRSAEGLSQGQADMQRILSEVRDMRAASLPGALALLETERMARCAQMVMAAALARTESRGAHQRRDFPQTDARWLTHLSFHRTRGTVPYETPIQ